MQRFLRKAIFQRMCIVGAPVYIFNSLPILYVVSLCFTNIGHETLITHHLHGILQTGHCTQYIDMLLLILLTSSNINTHQVYYFFLI